MILFDSVAGMDFYDAIKFFDIEHAEELAYLTRDGERISVASSPSNGNQHYSAFYIILYDVETDRVVELWGFQYGDWPRLA